MKEITWRNSISEASREITGGTRLLMLFFHDPGNEGSVKTLNEILKEDEVVDIIERETAPVMFDINASEEIVRKYNVDWAPAFILCDETGRELDRWVGFLPKDEFIAQVLLSKGLAAFHLQRYQEAEREFEMLIDEHSDSGLVPEAQYFLGVARYKETGDHYKLGEVCEILEDKYPDNPWTKRCSIWSHLTTAARKPYVAYDQGGGSASGAY